MRVDEDAMLLRMFVGQSDKVDGHPAHEAIVLRAREMGMPGATVLRGLLGFGRSSVLRRAEILSLSQDLPMVIEIVGSREKVERFVQALTEITQSCLITTEKVQVVRYGDEGSR